MAVGMELGISFEDGKKALAGFTGARRRLQVMGDAKGILVVDDYAHHPTEIMATLSPPATCWGDLRTGARGFSAAPVFPHPGPLQGFRQGPFGRRRDIAVRIIRPAKCPYRA